MKLRQNNAPDFLYSRTYSFIKVLLKSVYICFEVEDTFCEIFPEFVVLKIKL